MLNVHPKTFRFALAQVVFFLVLIFNISPSAYGQNTAPTADFDGDGIINSVDLDDDNDGIPDSDEYCQSSIILPATNSIAAVTEQTVPTGWTIAQSSPDIATTAYSIYGGWVVGSCTGTVPTPPNGHQSWVNFYSNTQEAFKTNLSNLVVGRTYILKVYYARFGSTTLGQVTVKVGGTVVDQYTPVTGCGWDTRYVTFTAGATSQDLQFQNTGAPSPMQNASVSVSADALYEVCDTDNDGIINQFDLDSDGDGCPDAKESGVTGNLSSGSVKNGSGGAVTSTTTIANAIAGTTGSYGANGLNDAVETTTESGVLSYTSTYRSYALVSGINICTGLDSDGDSIADAVDLDDDNDGVLDTIEQTSCNTPITLTPTSATSSPVYGGNTAVMTINSSGFTGSGLSALATAPATLSDAWLLKDPETSGFIEYVMPAGSNVGGVALWAPDAYNYGGGDGPPKDFTVEVTYDGGRTFTSQVFTTAQPNSSGALPGAQTFYFPKALFNVTKIRLNILSGWYDINGNSVGQVSTEGITVHIAYNMFLGEFRAICGNADIDTDSDGIPNRLDTDSDGDGCPDAVEAGTTMLATSGVSNGAKYTATTIPAPYGSNGFADGLETSAGSGTYASIYNYAYAVYAQTSRCLDSDGDTVVDVIDLDDDNDGVLDLTEGATCAAMPTYTFKNIDGTTTGAAGYNAAFPAWMKNSYTEAEAGFKVIFDQPVSDLAFEFASIYQDDRVGDFSVKLSNGTIFNNLDFELLTSYAPTNSIWTPQPNSGSNFTGNFSKFTGSPFNPGVPYFKPTAQGGQTAQSWGIVHLLNIPGVETIGISEVSFKIIGGSATSGTGGLAIYGSCLSYQDTDNDGIPNLLDLDSDGDNCPDAKEAGVTGTLNSGNVRNGTNGAVTSTASVANAIAAGGYGANGLADGVETTPESGVLAYNATYLPFAVNQSLAVCADTDSDGIADNLDLDDDNDGVLDDAELSCVSPLNAVAPTAAGAVATYENNQATFKTLAGTLSKVSTRVYDTSIDVVQLAATSSTSITLDNSYMLLKFLVADLDQSESVTLKVYDYQNNLIQLNANNLIEKGSYVNVTYPAGASMMLTAAGSTAYDGSTSTLSNALLGIPQVAKRIEVYKTAGANNSWVGLFAGCNDQDTDNDGKLNRLDLDSDGDGCSDAIESKSSVSATSTSVFPTGSDTNSNGLLNVYEGGTAGTINYTSIYTPYALSSNLAACADTDGDTIPNNVDIDDDNDGILDNVESPDCFYTENDWHFGNRPEITVTSGLAMTSPQNQTPKLVDGKNSGVSYDVRFVATTAVGTGQQVYKFAMGVPVKLAKVTLSYTGTASQFNAGTKLIIRGSNDGTTWTNLSPEVTYDATVDANNATETSTIFPYPATTQYATSGNIFTVSQNANKYLYYDIFWSSGGGVNANGYANEVYFDVASGYQPGEHPKVDCSNDTDGDGKLNHVDLDSDGDGCSDAKETRVSGTLNTSGSLSNALANGPYGTNGFADALETSADNGTYTGTYVYGNAIDSSINACTDSDGDSVPDLLDLDDDNDGILDSVECPAPGAKPLLSRFDLNSGGTATLTQTISNWPEELYVDIWTLDNNFNLKVNNTNITTVTELNFAPMGSTTVYPNFTDVVLPSGRALQQPTGSVWTYPAGAQRPLMRVRISKNGQVKIFGLDGVNGTGNYQEMVLVSAEYQQVPINLNGSNTVVFGQNPSFNPTYLNAEFNTFNGTGFCDTDGDGVENRLDLDSDNDGCSDAYEAKTTTNTGVNYKFTSGFGTNGFVDSKETTADNGIYNGYYPYDFAITASVKACLDTDTDGIPDVTDIDDDNDGILDDIESPSCFYTLLELAKPTAVSSELTLYNATATYALSNSIDASSTTYSAFTSGQYLADKEILKYTANGQIAITSLKLDLDFRAISTDASSTFRFQGSSDNVIWDNLNSAPVSSLTYTPPATLVLNNDLQPGKKYKYYRLYGVAGTSNYGGVANATFNLTAATLASQNPKSACVSDVDGDNIANHLDLDADGDGCPDAKETSIPGTLLAGTIQNLASGSTTTVVSTSGVSNAIANGTYGDNGFADALETATESGIYTGTYNYDNAFYKGLNACADTDADGIGDLVDIDDDNDGILDAVESPACFFSLAELAQPMAVSTELAQYSSYVIGNSTDGSSSTLSAFAPSVSWVNKEIFKLTALKPILISGLNLDLSTWALSSAAGNTFKLQASNDNATWTDLSTAVASTGTTGSFVINNTLSTATKYNYFRVIGVAGTTYYGGVSDIKFVLSTSVISSLYTKPTCTTGTADGDALPNHLDLDSDGDGCSDALEASTTTDRTTNFSFTGTDFGANGFKDGLEKMNAESGYYNGVYTYFFATNNAINFCTDADGDGTPDWNDLDNDNDGVLDAIEAPSCFYSSEEMSIPTAVSTELVLYSTNLITSSIDNVSTTQSAFDVSQNWVNKEIFKFTANNYIAISGMNFDLVNWALSSVVGNTFKLQGSGDNVNWTDLSTPTYSTGTTGTFTISNTLATNTKFKYFRILGVAGTSNYGGVKEARFNLATSVSPSANPKPTCTTDTDNDGILNQFDLDSDGDGCSDAIESGSSTTATSTSTYPTGSDTVVNGLLDVYESATPGVVNYRNYYSNYAVRNSINACSDFDSDGARDVFDLDDDNDGVLDLIEQGTCTSTGIDLTKFTFNGTAVSAKTSNSISSATSGTWISSYSNETLTLPISLVFKRQSPTSGVAMFGLISVNETQTPANWSDGGYKFYPNQATDYGLFPNAWTYTNTAAANDEYRLDISSTGYVTVKINGVQQAGFQGTNAAYRLVLSALSTPATFTNVSISDATNPALITCQDFDTDGDGIVNRLDLDSDGDGCSDAFESGSSTNTSSNFQFTGANADFGTNGFYNAVEKTSAESGIFNGLYTYDYAISNAIKSCRDTDGDGVLDVTDIDDDNDGVLDAIESFSCFFSLNELKVVSAISSELLPYSTYALANAIDTPTGTVTTSGFATGQNWVGKEIFRMTAPTFESISGITFDLASWPLSSATTSTFKLQGSGDNTNWTDLSAATYSTATTGSFTITNSLAPSTRFKYFRLVGVAGTSGYGGVSNIMLNTSSISSAYPKASACTVSNDADNIPNHLDLDSDGDGCSDAIEASSSNTATSTSVFPTGTDTNGNGLLDAYESSTAGEINYVSTYANYAVTTSVNACTDTDNDGVRDVDDIDDDNDGVLDTNECNTSAAQMFLENFETSVVNPYDSSPLYQPGVSMNGQLVTPGANGTNKALFDNTGAGTYAAGDIIWGTKTPITVKPYSTYEVSYYMKDQNGVSFPRVETWINGVKLHNAVTITTSWVKYTYLWNSGGSTSLDLAIANLTFTGSGNDFYLDEISVVAKCVDQDSDGDGVVNRLDLDSDGDGCFDAVEAKTVTALTQSTVASPYGANGFANSIETAAESGVYTGTYLYSRATDASIKACTDTDFDGVPDIDDLDDDNDGLLDTAEYGPVACMLSPSCIQNPSLSSTVSGIGVPPSGWSNFPNGGSVDINQGNWQISYGQATPSRTLFPNSTASTYFIYGMSKGGGGTLGSWAPFGESFQQTLNCLTIGTTYHISFRGAFTHSPGIVAAVNYETTPTSASFVLLKDGVQVSQAPNQLLQATQQTVNLSFVATSTTHTIAIAHINSLSTDLSLMVIEAGSGFVCTNAPASLNTKLDTDGDGIPNSLDLDSDGDGCSDANEAYNNATAQGTDGNSYYGTGTPPTVDASGKVTTASYTATSANTLTVGRASVITAQPVDVNTLPNATNITYAATVTPGSGTTTYQWQVSTNGGGTWTNITNNATYSGATTASLTISTATIAMKEYRYRLNIAQSDYICGNLTSSAARLIMTNTPTVTDDVATAIEDTPLNGSVLTNDTGSGGSAITVTSFTINGTTYTAGQTASIPNVGTFTLRANGTYTFTPAANYNGAVPVISYLATDANGGSDTGDLSISITAVNDPVVVVNETVSTNQGTVATGSVLTNDTDADGNTLTITQFTVNGVAHNVGDVVSIPGKGTITVAANGTFTFTPIATYSGAVPVIGYTVSDGNGSSVNGTLTINVVDVNDAPLAADDITTTLQNTPVSGNVLTNDSDPENNTLSITKITIAGVDYPAGTTATIANVGTVVVNANGTYTFTPTSTFTGAAPVITYTVSDGTTTSTAALKVAVTALVNANPVAVADTKITTEDTPATGNVLSNDTDAEGNTLTVTSFTMNGRTYPAGTMETITGVGTIVVNANGTYTFTPLANYAGSVPVITYAISDGNGGTASGTLTLSITPVNDAPVATDDVATATEDSPVSGNVLTNDSDVEGNTLSVTQFVINGTTYTAGQTATLVGVGTFVMNANGTFTFTPNANYSGAVPTVTYTLSDGNGATDTGDLTVNITPVNDAPVASDDVANTPQGTVKTGDIVTVTDTDVDGNTLTLTQFKINGLTYAAGSTANIPGVGTLQINADGTYTFTPVPAYVGTVPTVEYTISDGNGGTDTGNFVITVTDVNDPPAAARDEKTINQNTPAIGALLSNDTDSDNNALTIIQFVVNGVTTLVDPTNGGTYTLAGVGTYVVSANGNYTFTPLNTYVGTTPALTYTVSDGTATATSTLTVYVQPTDTAPVAMADANSIVEDGVATGNVLSNDTDAEGDVLSVTQFTVGGQTYPAGTTATIPNVGTLVVNADGTYTFTPLANYNGTVPSISYLVTDSAGATATGQLSITVSAVNDVPVAVNDQATTPEDTALTGNVKTNDSDVDGNTLTLTQFTVGGQTYTAGQTANISGVGSLQMNADGSFTFTPAANYNGAFSAVTYTISDGNGGTATANLAINITAVNDAPVASNDTETTPQGSVKTGDILTVADTDVDGNTLTLTQFSIGGVTYSAGTTANIPGVGTLVINADGTYTFTPLSTYVGTVPTVTYTISDGNGGTATGTFILTVTDVPEPPVATDDAATVGKNVVVSGNLVSNDTDPESNTLTIASYSINGVTGPFTLGSTITISSVGTMRVNADGTYVFTPLATYSGTVPALTYTVSDGNGGTDTGLLNITVIDTNTPPTATNDVVAATEDTPRTGNVLTNDSDPNGDAISVVSFVVGSTTYPAGSTATIPNVGTIAIAANGAFTFTPFANYNGTVPAVNYTITDGLGGISTPALNITVSAVNDTPIAVNDDNVSGPEDSPITGNVLANDSDPDGTPISVSQFTIAGVVGTFTAGQTATIPGKGTLVINANGTFTFTPLANYFGPVPTITYTAVDGSGASANATLNMSVTPVNDPPVVVNDVITVPEGTTGTGNVLTNDSDVENGTLLVTQFAINGVIYTHGSIVAIPNVGTFVMNEDGTYSFTGVANYSGPVPVITYTVTDGTGGVSTGTLTVTIQNVNDAPVVVSETVITPEDTPATGNVLTNDTDPEGTTLSITQFLVGGVSYTAGQTATIPGVGTVTISSSGAYVFTPVANYFGNVPPVIYTVSDGQATTTGSLTISVTSVNDAPVAVNDTKVGEVNANVAGNVLTNDTDVENGTLSVVDFVINGTTYPAGQTATIPNVGTVTMNADGTYTFVPALNYAGTLPAITYNISDGAGGTASATLALTITFDTDGDGIPDAVEKGPGVAPDTDGDGIPDYKDLDSDNDGILDSVENAACVPAVMPCDIDGDGIPNYLDLDSDNDGISDVIEAGGIDGNADGKVDGAVDAQGIPVAANGGLTPPNTDGTGASNPYDVDSDGDGIPDSIEGTRDTDGDGTPDYKDLDSDGDGISDAIEGSADADGDGIPNYRDLDSDGDGIPDATEGIVDTDTDGRPNFLDTDSDGDGIPDATEGATDTDGDGVPNYLDLDSDGDGIPDSVEGTIDTDGDGIPNYKDTDSDGDGIPDSVEKGANPLSPRDTDGDGIPDYKDLDSDGDGIPDSIEGVTDTDGDGLPNYMDPDSDGDGIPDSIEKGIDPLHPLDTDGDGTPDYLDTDSDNDGISDSVEKGPDPLHPVDTDGDGIPDYRDLDSDNDGISDAEEGTTDTDGDGIPNYRDLDSDGDGKPDQQEGVVDTDGDGTPNYLDLDSDGDGVLDAVDQCPLLAGNLASGCPLDSDNDGVPDVTDFDDDNDGILDTVENAACVPAAATCDTDGDGIPNNLDPDSDNDGISDVREANGTDVNGDGVVDGAVDSNGVPTAASGGLTPPNTDGTGASNPYDTDSDGDGIPDSIEKGPNGNAPLDSDGDGIPNYLDTDSDGDGISDSIERGTGTAIADTDGDGAPDYLDLDSDGDGITDAVEGTTDTDGDGIPNFRDVDSDGDGIPDSIEGTVDTDGDGIPNYLDVDSDGDGIPDSVEKGPNPLSPIDTDGDGIPDYKDLDSDGDGIPDATEGAIDTDGDGIPNYRDLDSDGDGIPDAVEGTVDTDGDGIPNYKDLDSDGDGISDAIEGTMDTDGDGMPNYKDLDSDGDGISDAIEGARDTDGDGTPDYLDLDSDGDGISDAIEGTVDSDGDGIPNFRDLDSDGDGISDAIEGTVDTDGDGIPNYLDTDSDGDGVPDSVEGNVDTDGDGMPDYLDLDSDGDGVLDATDTCRVNVGDVANNGCPTDFDGDRINDSLDYDDDNDGILDTIENAACSPASLNCDTDGDGIPNRFDLDSDGDGIKDVREANGLDVNADGIVDGPVDANGVPTAANGGLTPPNTDGTGGLNPYDVDSDGDGIPDSAEKGTNGNIPRDTDGDGIPDYLDLDSDNDGILDAAEGNVDTDGDGIPNYRDLDSDGDGVLDATEVADGTSPTNACSLIPAHQTVSAPGWSASDCDGDGNPNSTDPHMNAPTAQNDNFVISGTGQQAFNILANDDFLAGGGVTINRLVGSAGGTALGTVSFNANTGMLIYTPAPGEISGLKTVVYQVCKGIVCATATAYLNFCDVNDPTVDCDGDGVTNGQESTDGTDPLNACSLLRSSQTLTPSASWSAGDCDGDGNPNSTDPHVATAVANNDLVQIAGTGAQTFNILANDDFLAGHSTMSRLIGNAGGTAQGTVSFNNVTGEMTYTPAVGETSGTKTIVYQVCNNSVCATATITLSFCNPNDPAADCDGDGVTNGQEAIDGTNPNDACSLNFRSQTLIPSSAWLAADCDGDGVTNGVERTDRTDPTDPCSLLLTSQVRANASSGWLAADCDGDGNPNGTDSAPLDFCVDGSGQIPVYGTPAYEYFRDADCDGDGISNGLECHNGGTRCEDTDGDGTFDYMDIDSDGDGILDYSERYIDSDGDGRMDYVDLDSDNDGILDSRETARDSDGDGVPNYLDFDADGDGILDSFEGLIKFRNQVDNNNNGRVDCTIDANGNGLMDCVETAMGGASFEVPDTDGDGILDFLDLDSDNDGILDSIELRGDPDGDGLPNYRDLDSDGDKLGDVVETTIDKDGDGIPNFLDLDSDGDGILDRIEGPTTCVTCTDRVDNNEDGWDDRNEFSSLGWTIDTDQDGLPDYLDLDSDNDGIPDAVEGIVDTDGDGVPNFRDLDSDNDGIPDAIEGTVDTDGDGIPNYLDVDSDNDGIPDAVEGIRDTDGDGKPDYLDTDSDNDGIPDSVEAGKDPAHPVDTDGDGVPDFRDLDSDNDGIPDAIEAGKDPAHPVDTDKDGIPDFRDLDSDNDGIPDAVEAGKDPMHPVDTDKDGIPDYLDLDSDNDGIPDAFEAGKDPINPVDTDGDGTPDYRDLDSDNDGIPDAVEGIRDTDGDGIADFRDLDSDNDGIPDAVEAGKDPKHPVDSDGDGIPDYRDVDSDNDGIPDAVEGKRDTDGDGLPDYLDVDSDNDGYSDKHEAGANPANPVDTDKDGIPDYRDLDSDADGISDKLEDDLNYGALPDCDHDGIENRIDPDQCETFAPQGISPNGDGQNDVLIIPGIMGKGNNTLTIYNRWGNIVYQKDNYQNDWGGQTDRAFTMTADDHLLPDGTYYYVIDFKGKYPEVGQYVYINRLEK